MSGHLRGQTITLTPKQLVQEVAVSRSQMRIRILAIDSTLPLRHESDQSYQLIFELRRRPSDTRVLKRRDVTDSKAPALKLSSTPTTDSQRSVPWYCGISRKVVEVKHGEYVDGMSDQCRSQCVQYPTVLDPQHQNSFSGRRAYHNTATLKKSSFVSANLNHQNVAAVPSISLRGGLSGSA